MLKIAQQLSTKILFFSGDGSVFLPLKIPAQVIRDLHLLFLGISASDFVCTHFSINLLIPRAGINE